MPLAQLRAAAQSDGFGRQLTNTGPGIHGLSVLVAAGAGLTTAAPAAENLPGIAAVPITEPRIVHRTELLHSRTPVTPVAELLDALRPG